MLLGVPVAIGRERTWLTGVLSLILCGRQLSTVQVADVVPSVVHAPLESVAVDLVVVRGMVLTPPVGQMLRVEGFTRTHF